MDIQTWEKSVIAWLNLLNNSSSPITSINQINDTVLLNVVKKIKSDYEKSPVEFLKESYPNLTESEAFRFSKSTDYLSAATLMLVYVSLCQKPELNEIRDLMCTKLDNLVQLNISEVLQKLLQYEDFFGLSYNAIKNEIFSEVFASVEKHSRQDSFIGDGALTPVKHNLSDSISNSPLQEFFQTPKRSFGKKSTFGMCGDGDHIKKIQSLTNLLNEEELEKASLQEQLNIQTQKCYEYEAKLRCKVEEINLLKLEWENDSKKNEGEISSLRNDMVKILDEEKKRKNELCYYEKHVSTLETDLAAIRSEFDRVKNQLNISLSKCKENEFQLREATELNLKFQKVIEEKETALKEFRDIYANLYNEEKTIDVSFANKSLDVSEGPAENLGVVMDTVLREENASLKKIIEETKLEKETLTNEIMSLKEKLTSQTSAISELNFLNKELNLKFENVEKTEKELARVQEELIKANCEINKLIEENGKIKEQYTALNTSLKDIINCENLKKIFQINFLTLAEEFKGAQERLELEIKKISKLAANAGEKQIHFERIQEETTNDLFHFKVLKSLNREEFCYIPEKTFSVNYVIYGDEKLNNLVDILKNFENCHAEWSESKIQMEKTCNQINFSILNLQDKIRDLKNSVKQSVKEKMEIQNNLKKAEEKMWKIEANNESEIQKLKEELKLKESKIKEFEGLIQQSKQIQELFSEKEILKQKTMTITKENLRESHEGEGDKSLHQTNVTFCKKVETSRRDPQEFDDSLEEIPVTNKTFDIVNLEERNISDKTFSIKKDFEKETTKNISTWVISPPHKGSVKVPAKDTNHKQGQGECWIVPLNYDNVKENKPKKVSSSVSDLRVKTEDLQGTELRKEILTLTKECECLKFSLIESEQKRKKDRETYERNYNNIRQSIIAKYENQLEHLKNEMKHLYTKEMAKQTSEKNNLIAELQEQNKRDKERIDQLINDLWDLREKLLQEQATKRDLERNYSELKVKYENILLNKDTDEKSFLGSDLSRPKDPSTEEVIRSSGFSQLTNTAFPTIPTEDEDEVFDNRFLEDMKTGVCKTEKPEDRLKELQYRNSLCLPHLKSSYPGETQFHNPCLFKENELKFGQFQFGQESQSLTDSDHSMTKSLLPDNKGKKKEQTSYRKPGPPTPIKNGGRLSLQSGDLRLTPRNVLRDLNEPNDRSKGTPNPLKIFRSGKILKTTGSAVIKDENTAPVTPRKKIKFFRKPFGARDH